ncbi:MAG: ATP-binding cassette domain-containing protein [Planctomycetaceae bacterium]|jgi:cobalt/nickel transport system ATP-binding protein|nr:ATP-binding cassette domain-containing protein [Planctomycetaceae bacterium]
MSDSPFAVEICRVSHCYPDGTESLKNVSLSIAKNRKLAILGANGSGKTTLMMHFNGLNLAQSGTVKVFGETVTQKNLREIRQKVGVLFDNPDNQLFSTTIFDDVAFGPFNMGYSEQEIIKRTNLALAETGICKLSEKPPHNISLGQKKKAAIAGLLSMQPKIFVMDEPFSGLDPESVTDFFNILDRLHQQGCTLIISTHNVDQAYAWADDAAILNNGHLVALGNWEILCDKAILAKAQLRLPMLAQIFGHTEFRPRTALEAEVLMKTPAPTTRQ